MLPNIVLAVLSWAAIIGASTLQINNYCADSIWLTLTDPAKLYSDPFEVKSGQAYAAGDNSGDGNSLGMSFSKAYYSDDSSKFVLGYSISGGRLWWSNGKAKGDPFDGKHFNVTTPDADGKVVCGSTTTYDQVNQNCPDGNFTLVFNPCFE